MSEQIENPPNKETEMATSQEEASEDQPENPPQQHTEEQPKNPEQQPSAEGPEEVEENKKTVTEENRPHKSAKEDDDSNSLRDEKQLNESVDRAKYYKNPRNGNDKNPRTGDDKNPRNVPLESDQLEPFLVKLEHDPKTQLNFWTGLRDYRRINGVYPFERETAMEDFLNNWLLARVPLLEFQQTFQRLRQRYTTTEAAIGGNLNSLNPPERDVFLLANEILFAYYTEIRETKGKIQETGLSTFSNKPLLIDGSKAPPEEPVHPIKQQKTKMVVDTKLKLKQKVPEYLEKEEVKPRENPEEKERENTVEEQNENPRENTNEDSEEAWVNANFDTLCVILHAIADYQLTSCRFPYDDASDMEDFVKNWLSIDLSVSECLEIIKRLKKYFDEQFWKVMDQGLFFLDKKQEDLCKTSDVLWDMEPHLDSDDEELKHLFNGGGELDYIPELRSMLPSLVKNSFEQGIGVFSNVIPVKYPVLQEMLRPPILPSNKQKAGTSDDSSSMNSNDPGGHSVQSDDIKRE
ncbi:hypothetical protein ACOSQ3_031095 [Xanthoceras sorbifolium]